MLGAARHRSVTVGSLERSATEGDDTSGLRARYCNWLIGKGAAARSIPILLDGFARFLNAEGFVILRCNLATDTIHPQMTSIRHVWFDRVTDVGPLNPKVVVERRQYQIGEAMIDEVFLSAGNQLNPQFQASPFFKVQQVGELYERVRPVGEAQPYPLFDDLAVLGCTAYFGLKLTSFAGMLQRIGISTAKVDGLSRGQIDALRWMLQLLTLHINTLIEHRIKTMLARSYIGRDPGSRVCDGMIELGRVFELDAAIWFSDLRGFTAISDGMAAETLVEHLNAYFDQIVAPIYDHGGEVMKYIGDGVLAIFPVSAFKDAAEACNAALKVASDARRNLDAMNAERSRQGQTRLDHGVGLHFGTAQYGNIGSLERLDFTLIGREVNIASRIEELTKECGEPLLLSASFASHCTCPTRPIGSFSLRGVATPMQIFIRVDVPTMIPG